MKAIPLIATITTALLFVALGIAGRFLPHLWNATPVGAAALVLGARFGWKKSAVAVLAMMLISDFFFGFYHWPVMVAVYGSFMMYGVLGFALRRLGFAVVSASIIGSTVFFLVTNWAVWQFSPWYEKSFSGLLQSYELGLPFYRNMILGDVAYAAFFYGLAVFIWYGSRKISWLIHHHYSYETTLDHYHS